MTVVEGMMLTVVLNIDTGILVGNLTLMVTDGTTSMSMFNSKLESNVSNSSIVQILISQWTILFHLHW